MKNIIILSSFHIEIGKCNSNELYNIIERIAPDVIFEELSNGTFNHIYTFNQPPQSLEAKAVKRYVSTNDIKHFPVDTLHFDFEDLFEEYDIISNNSSDYTNLLKKLIERISQDGYSFINSILCTELIDEVVSLEKDYLLNLNDYNLISKYENDKYIFDEREYVMIQNIINYSRIHSFEKGLFICGVQHRKSLISKINELNNNTEIELNWTLYDENN